MESSDSEEESIGDFQREAERISAGRIAASTRKN
jgi:hypothetical protein